MSTTTDNTITINSGAQIFTLKPSDFELKLVIDRGGDWIERPAEGFRIPTMTWENDLSAEERLTELCLQTSGGQVMPRSELDRESGAYWAMWYSIAEVWGTISYTYADAARITSSAEVDALAHVTRLASSVAGRICSFPKRFVSEDYDVRESADAADVEAFINLVSGYCELVRLMNAHLGLSIDKRLPWNS